MAPKIPQNYQNSQRSHRAIPLSSIDPQSAAEFEMLLALNRTIWEVFSIEVDLNKNKTGNTEKVQDNNNKKYAYDNNTE